MKPDGRKAEVIPVQTNATVIEKQGHLGLVRLQWSFRGLIAVFALIECWYARFQNNPDGVSYMDMGDQYWRGNWHAALNAYWSPLYGWLAGLTLQLTKPTMRWEYPVIHLMNFAIFLVTLICFEFFWRELLAAGKENALAEESSHYQWALGYLLFICIYLGSRELEGVGADLLVATLVYLAFGMMLRFSAGRAETLTAALLGATLGFGYLAKAAMLPFGMVVLITLLAVVRNRPSGMRLAAVALLSFLMISTPYIAALSWNYHRFTIGDTGKLNYAWSVNRPTTMHLHWQGDGGASAPPLHSSRKILNWPEVFEFATPITGTYPVWYDPTYWWAGVDTKPHPVRQIAQFFHNLGRIANYLFRELGALTTVVLMTFLLSDRGKGCSRKVIQFWPILIPTIAVFLMYAMIIWMSRYTTGVMLTGFGVLIASISISEEKKKILVLRAASLALSVMAAVMVLQSMYQNHHDTGHWEQQVELAEQLRTMGIEPGERVALIGMGQDESDWARLDRVKIVAEVTQTPETGDSITAFWNASTEGQAAALNALKSTGGIAVVSIIPPGALAPGWVPLKNTGHAIIFFR